MCRLGIAQWFHHDYTSGVRKQPITFWCGHQSIVFLCTPEYCLSVYACWKCFYLTKWHHQQWRYRENSTMYRLKRQRNILYDVLVVTKMKKYEYQYIQWWSIINNNNMPWRSAINKYLFCEDHDNRAESHEHCLFSFCQRTFVFYINEFKRM